jgi:hypothetical protein
MHVLYDWCSGLSVVTSVASYAVSLSALVAVSLGVIIANSPFTSQPVSSEPKTMDSFWNAFTDKPRDGLLVYNEPLNVSSGPVPEYLQLLTVCRGGCATYVRYILQSTRFTRGVMCHGADLNSSPVFIDDPQTSEPVPPSVEAENLILKIACLHEGRVSQASPQTSP